MKIFFENVIEIFVIIVTAIWQICSSLFKWIFRLIGKFFSDVLKNMYGRVVTATALIILAFIVSFFYTKQ